VATRRRFSTPALIFSSFWMALRITSFSSLGGRWPGPGCRRTERSHGLQASIARATGQHRLRHLCSEAWKSPGYLPRL
jgi:hypothetical protein